VAKARRDLLYQPQHVAVQARLVAQIAGRAHQIRVLVGEQGKAPLQVGKLGLQARHVDVGHLADAQPVQGRMEAGDGDLHPPDHDPAFGKVQNHQPATVG
jgi:hypothetical protein